MNDAERLRVLVRALLPFALAAHLNADVRYADDDEPLRIMDNGDYPYATTIDYGWMRELKAADLRAAADALRAAGYADALTDTDARAALEGDDICAANEIIDDDEDAAYAPPADSRSEDARD